MIELIDFWFIGFGLLLILILIAFEIKNSRGKKKSIDDEKMIKIIKEELDKNGFNSFELESIVSMNDPNITSVIVNAGYIKIALEMDNNSGRVIHKERIIS